MYVFSAPEAECFKILVFPFKGFFSGVFPDKCLQLNAFSRCSVGCTRADKLSVRFENGLPFHLFKFLDCALDPFSLSWCVRMHT